MSIVTLDVVRKNQQLPPQHLLLQLQLALRPPRLLVQPLNQQLLLLQHYNQPLIQQCHQLRQQRCQLRQRHRRLNGTVQIARK